MVIGAWELGESTDRRGRRVTVSSGLDLKADGTYSQSSRSAAASVGGGASGCASGWSSGERRKLEGYSLQLTDPGGRVTRGIAFPRDADRMRFNGTLYTRPTRLPGK